MKVIPAIDLMNGQVVRLYKGDPNQKTVYSDDPISIAKKWESAGADLIHLVDLDATLGLGVILGKALYENKISIEETKKLS
ncbi:HisA/HisF-related TIM barrel protein [Nitrosopumilus sp.]|nr:HisA/HisF-related TIM barrel protein [Nitrosopumilus sp.]